MRIFSNVSLQFDHPTQAFPAEVVQHQTFATVPDWVKESSMFKLALADESITVIESKHDEYKAQYGDSTDSKAEKARLAAEAKAKAKQEAEEAAKVEEARLKAEAEELAKQ
ncbi:hypothetical protein [Paenibacillus foliorum]|uniref:hypothetical protein n=1 Tax=Paenibacillus foliorum TaxID=2654974 RepID=UPI001C110310|nr:hypothetical protein [Paenibacillus foliorum]